MRFFSAVLGCLFSFLCISSCTFKQAVVMPPAKSSPAPIRDRYVFLINMDGSRPQDLQEWIREGSLPNMDRLFFQSGAVFENAINVYPTVSIPNHQAFISGLFPGHHGLPALDWFSRPLNRYVDYLRPKDMNYTPVLMFNYLQVLQQRIYTDAPQTLFDQLAGYPTLSVMEPSSYGATDRLPKKPPVIAALDFHYREKYQTIDFVAMRETLKYLRKVPEAQLPRFSFINFYGMDNMGHFEGPDSGSSRDLAIHYDRFLGELVQTLKKRGIWEKSTLVLVSDHGQHYLDQIVSLPEILQRVGLQVNSSDPVQGQVVWGDHGTGTSNLYFKVGSDWTDRPTYPILRNFPVAPGRRMDLVQTLVNQPEIEMVFLPENPLTTHIFGKGQHARIERLWREDGFVYRYTPDAGQDPLGYLQNPQIAEWVQNKEFVDAEAWLEATAATSLPDVVVGLPQLFDDRRTGDMILQTPFRVQFKETKISGHGSLHREDRRVNLMIHGPDILAGRFPYARITDTYPTLLAIFGLQSPQAMDGVVRREIFRNPNLLAGLRTWPKNLTALRPAEFRRYLLSQQEEESLTPEEKDKIAQLLFDMDYYERSWRVALDRVAPDKETLMATGLIEEKPLQDDHGLSPSHHRRRLDSHERGNLPGSAPGDIEPRP